MGLSAITLALAKKYSERIIAEKTAAIDQAILDAIKESKFYTDTVASQLISFNIKIADTLPSESEASEHTLYLIKKENISDTSNIYYEYLFIEGKWELIGVTNLAELDLSEYWKSEQVKEYVDNKIYSLPIASADTLGIIKVDTTTLDIAEDGTLSVKETKTQQVAEETAQQVINKNFVSISDDEISNLF